MGRKRLQRTLDYFNARDQKALDENMQNMIEQLNFERFARNLKFHILEDKHRMEAVV